MTDALEETARKIAEQGRDALLARLRPAFAEAAASHADIVELEPEQLEQMVQRGADRADGLQWRRALAGVAVDELGIGLGEALGHPAVARAQEIVGAPSYEDSLAQISSAQNQTAVADEDGDAGTEAPEAAATHAAEESAEPPLEEPDREEPALEEPDRAEPDRAEPDRAEPDRAEPDRAEPDRAERDGPAAVRLDAVHLGGIANLAPAEGGIELRLSEEGLDIVRGEHESLGRLTWPEVRALNVASGRGRRRRRQRAQLVISTQHGDASFEIPDLAPEELRERISPWSAGRQ